MSAQVITSESEASVMATPSQESANQEPTAQPKTTIADELAKLRTETLGKIAQIEDHLRAIKGRKRAYEAIDTPIDQSDAVTGRINRRP